MRNKVRVSLPRLLQSSGEGQTHPGLEAARQRLLSVCGDPFLFADWERVLFLHFLISPERLRAQVPPPFELELYDGKGCISIVAVTMRNFRPCQFDPLTYPFCCIREERFLNFRTYVRWNGEPGAFFLHGWLSRPAGLPWPSSVLGLPYTFANCDYEHSSQEGMIRGSVSCNGHQFSYCASEPDGDWHPAEPGSLAEFTMERYSGFFSRGNRGYVFRAWHPLWLQQAVNATIEKDDLLSHTFEWWKEAQFVGANFAPGFERVGLGKAHSLPEKSPRRGHRALSSFFEMP
jgi:uncharacterized protein YqjF (DUF2071 family)